MWISKAFFDLVLADNKTQAREITSLKVTAAEGEKTNIELRAQKARDDVSIDWMRHRINALEKQNAILLAKAAGVHVPVPEIVPSRPGSIAGAGIDFSTMPSFEDVGDEAAARLGISHDAEGRIQYDKPESVFAEYKRQAANS